MASFPLAQSRIVYNTSTDPYLNLAYEQYILEHRRSTNEQERQLMVWQNAPSVVLGRNQNPWLECNMHVLNQHHIKLVRRPSGGGTVYHDLGNSNITVFAPQHKPLENLEFVVSTLRGSFGIAEAGISERKDVFVGDKKVSGSAYRIAGHQCYHHMTMLIKTDLTILKNSLYPTTQVTTKATPSVRSGVANLADFNPAVTHERLAVALSDHFIRQFGDNITASTPSLFSEVTTDDLLQIPDVVDRAAELRSWDYIWANTPAFEQDLKWTPSGSAHPVTLRLHCEKGHIAKITVESPPADFALGPASTALLSSLEGHKYHYATLLPKFTAELSNAHSGQAQELAELLQQSFLACTLR